MTDLIFDAVQCRLMSHVAAGMTGGQHHLFWQILPDIIPDLAAHLPALAAAIRGETNRVGLSRLSSHPLPAALSPETVDWRTGLVAIWEKRLKAIRQTLDSNKWYWEWEYEYRSCVRGLAQVDRCGMPPELTCQSVLPVLLNEARYVQKRLRVSRPSSWELYRELVYGQLECLSALGGWQPGPNIMTDPSALSEWKDFWLEMYQDGYMDIPDNRPDDPIILKGIAAKALLNLLETDGIEEARMPAGMETLLLESLTIATDVAGKILGHDCRDEHKNDGRPDLLSWQPQDMTRFPKDGLVKLPEILLKRLKFLCHERESRENKWYDKECQGVLHATLKQITRWSRDALLAACHIDVLPEVVADLSDYIDGCMGKNTQSADFLSHELCRWFVRDEVANVKGGKQLLQKLENHWRAECESKYTTSDTRCIAWKGRMKLQRAGLATETPAAFQQELLEVIKNETSGDVRLILSLWRPGKDTPGSVQRRGERLWNEKLKSNNKNISRTAALAVLMPDPADDLIARRQKLRDVLRVLPEGLRPKLPVSEIMHLMGELPWSGWDMDGGQGWQFGSEERKFRIPTERITSRSTSAAVQTARPHRGGQKPAVGEPQPDHSP